MQLFTFGYSLCSNIAGLINCMENRCYVYIYVLLHLKLLNLALLVYLCVTSASFCSRWLQGGDWQSLS